MDSKKIIIDPRCFGRELLCVGVKPSYAYTPNGQRGELQGYAYDICVPEHAFDHLAVKIPGDPQIDVPDGSYVPVVLTDLVVRPYVRDGRLQFSAAASGIKPAPSKG